VPTPSGMVPSDRANRLLLLARSISASDHRPEAPPAPGPLPPGACSQKPNVERPAEFSPPTPRHSCDGQSASESQGAGATLVSVAPGSCSLAQPPTGADSPNAVAMMLTVRLRLCTPAAKHGGTILPTGHLSDNAAKILRIGGDFSALLSRLVLICGPNRKKISAGSDWVRACSSWPRTRSARPNYGSPTPY
jgi:hypothetical protein